MHTEPHPTAACLCCVAICTCLCPMCRYHQQLVESGLLQRVAAVKDVDCLASLAELILNLSACSHSFLLEQML